MVGSGIHALGRRNLEVNMVVMAVQWDLLQPYVQSSRVILKNSVLWVMFLACMVTSVFFSFDSLFSAIFPQKERVRAAEVRAQNQVAGIISYGGTAAFSLGADVYLNLIQQFPDVF